MLTEEAREELIKQKYRVIGSHSAVKVCGWTKKMIRGEGSCYKHYFYGIRSNQCLQMSTSLSCANRCVFCWRGYKAPVGTDWKWDIDDPKKILEESIKAHHNLLAGIKGFEHTDKELYKESRTIKHVALSLTGEPIIYPKINEFLDLCNKQGISTFMVTNAQYPEAIKNLAPVTQLYISLDAPNKELLKKVDNPAFEDYWERLNKSLEYTAEKKQRTCIRITAIKGLNMIEPENYAELIKKARPDFIEVKAYMNLGASRERLTKENMPRHEEVVEFSEELAKFLPEYELASDHVASRVVMLARKQHKIDGKWHTWIDFNKWRELADKNPSLIDYSKETPETGMSGLKTKDYSKMCRDRKKNRKCTTSKSKK